MLKGSAHHALQDAMTEENVVATNTPAAVRGAQGRGTSRVAVQSADAQQLCKADQNQAIMSSK